MAELENQELVPKVNSEINIESIISAPLVAASKANAEMVMGQAYFLLRNCFVKKDDETYDPVMIQMSLTKSFINPDKDPSDPDYFSVQRLNFQLPMLCIIPLSSLTIDKVTVDFDMEITSATSWEATDDRVLRKPAQLSGKITSSSGDNSKSQYKSQSSSRLKVNINAGPLPLPVGVLAILDLYTKALQPVPSKPTKTT